MGVKKPLEDLSPSLAERIVQTLLDSRAETVQRNGKSCDPHFLHIFHFSRFLYWISTSWRGRGYRAACLRRFSLSAIIWFRSAAGRISQGPYLNPGCCEMS